MVISCMVLELGLRNDGSGYPARHPNSKAIAAALATAKIPATRSAGAIVGIDLVWRRWGRWRYQQPPAGEPEWNPGRNLYVERKRSLRERDADRVADPGRALIVATSIGAAHYLSSSQILAGRLRLQALGHRKRWLGNFSFRHLGVLGQRYVTFRHQHVN